MSFENFPYSNFHDLNLDWIVQKIKEAYSPDNPPENIVLSINGQTGHVELFTDNFIRLPDVTENAWNIFRIADDEAKGIQFDGDGAYRIYRDQRYKIYDEDNEPDYPVTSVNGQTGDVQISIPSALVRSVNGKTGAVITPFTNPNGDILALDTNSPGNRWGFSRQTTAGSASIYVDTSGNTVKAYISLSPAGGGSAQIFPLLTSADIPSSAGVVSINTRTGVVTLYGSDIYTTENGNTTIAQDINALNTEIITETNNRINDTNTLSSRINAEISDRQSADNYLQNNIDNLTDDIITNISKSEMWFQGLYNTSGGRIQPNTNFVSTIDYVPENVIKASTTEPETYTYRIYAWDSNDVYKGIIQTDNTIRESVSNIKYYREIDFRQLNEEFPGYKYKITLQKMPSTEIPIETWEKSILSASAVQIHTQQINNLQTTSGNHTQQINNLQTTVESHTQQINNLQTTVESHTQQINNLQTTGGVYKVELTDIVSMPYRFPDSGTDNNIRSTMHCMLMELSRPGVQHSDWTIETFNGYLTIAGTIRGLTNITLYLI